MAFVGYPSAFMYPKPQDASGKTALDHYPWGYYVRTTGETKNGFAKVHYRWQDKDGTSQDFAWIREDELQDVRLLEVNFVDIGQGDGCFIVFPDDQRMLIDAGERDNMYRFLRWRFNRKKVHIHNAIMTHPDQDHYLGFQAFVNDENFSFGNLFHNGIVERKEDDTLGPRTPGRGSVLTDVIETPEQLDRILNSAALVGRKRYPSLLKALRESGRTDAIWMLHHEDGHVPGYKPGENANGIVIEVLGPVVQRDNGEPRLPWIENIGKTKNGHSVVLRLTYGGVTMLLGGDLNIPSEHYLLNHYTGLSPVPETENAREELITAARKVFECDVLKACHHGSGDVEDVFVQAVNPLATVISSGDGEPHCHPRPDALGVYGKYARGRRPLIFSTELARSARETVQTPAAIQKRIDELVETVESSSATDAEKRAAKREIKNLLSRKERAVAVYGMITARTDGQKLIMTQKLEERRSSTGEKWDIHRFEPGPNGRLEYLAKH